jgi:hypothetical protein
VITRNTLLIEGWRIGFNKVGFTNLLRQELDLSLSAAKDMTDQLLEGKQLAMNVSSKDIDRISALVQDLGPNVRSDASLAEDSCQ